MAFSGFGPKAPAIVPRPVPMPRHSAYYRDPVGFSGERRARLLRQVRTLFGGSAQTDLHVAFNIQQQIVVRLDWSTPWAVVLVDMLGDPIAPCTFLLTAYDEDGETVAWQVGSDPLHQFPYLMVPTNYAQQEIDIIAGAASIGQVEVAVIDRRQIPGDQASGWLTERLSADGVGAIRGRRFRLTMPANSEGDEIVLADGPAGTPRMDSSYSAFRWTVRDTRETERKVRAFTHGGTTIVMPPGVLGGFGLPGSELVGEPTPIPATFRIDDFNGQSTAYFDFLLEQPVTEEMIEVLEAVEDTEEFRTFRAGDIFPGPFPPGEEDRIVQIRFWYFRDASVYWRPAGTTDPWSVLSNLFYPTVRDPVGGGEREPDSVNAPRIPPLLVRLNEGGDQAQRIRVPAMPEVPGETPAGLFGHMNAGKPFPDADQAVEVMVVHNGAPSEKYPLHVSGITSGELLRRLYDGEYSEPDPLTGDPVPTSVRYDPAALAMMVDTVLLRVTEPTDDVRSWAEKHVYAPTGYFPAVDTSGRISPLSQAAPATTQGLPLVNDAVAQPSPDWNAGEAIVNVLRFTYPRFYVSSVGDGADGIAVREVVMEFRDESSIGRHGEQVVTYDALASGATGNTDGEAEDGGVFEPGRALALDRKLYVFERYRQGAQVLAVPVRRSAAPDLRAGQWAVLDLSWIPDYVLRRRGAQFVGQVISIADEDCAWRGLVVEEALPITES